MAQSVQCYYLSPNSDAPNNPLPVLHYRGVLPLEATEDMATKFLTANTWEKRGAWGHIGIRHFHPNTHECYGIVSGRSTMLLGKINDGTGMHVQVQRGDVIVLPAGTAHSSIESTPDYFYIGVYPRRHPRWVNEHGKTPATHFRSTIRAVEMPEEDPVYGKDGPLLKLWRARDLARL
ncbi:Cupin domain protein [Metarhizium brunneum]